MARAAALADELSDEALAPAMARAAALSDELSDEALAAARAAV